jgi:uncharacterized delta-60 repeat protein
MKKIILLILVLPVCLKPAYSQPGTLDSLFGTNGIVKSDAGSGYNYELIGKKVLLQSNGSIYTILISGGQTLIAKKLANGAADLTYGQNGFSVTVGIAAVNAAFQPDGKIVVAGTPSDGSNNISYLTRYNINGTIDNTFSGDGLQSIDFAVASVTVQSDGKIVAAGSVNNNGTSYFSLARYTANGSLDISFSGDGKQTTSFGFSKPSDMGGDYPETDIGYSVAIQGDGKIVMVGEALNYTNGTREFAIARYTVDGNLDNTFSGDGKQTTDFGSDDYAYDLAFQTDGKIVVGGYSSPDGSIFNIAVARYNTDGSLDPNFDRDGKQLTNVGSTYYYRNSIAIQGDGKIVAEGVWWNGSNNDFAIVRYNTNGSLDQTFDGDGKLTTNFGSADDYANSIAIQRDGKIVLEGYSYTYTNTGAKSTFSLARYSANGSLDTTFNKNGKLTESLRQGYTVYSSTAVQKDGKIIAAGYTWNGSNNVFIVSRYNTSGSLDTSFDHDGKVLTAFGTNDSYANSATIQSDGKIVVAGQTWNGSNNDVAIARYNTNGSLDNTFSIGGQVTTGISFNDDFANAVAIQSDGKIVVAGYTNTGVNVDFLIIRYNANGIPDNTFGGNGKQTTDFTSSDDFGYSMAIQGDGKIVVGGYSNAGFTGNEDFAIVRYNTNGSLDTAFDHDGMLTTDFGSSDDYANSMLIQSDGKIVAGGRSGNYGMYKIALARYNTNGSPDLTYSSDGKQVTDFGLTDAYANSIALQSDGKIVAGGSSNDNFAVARFKTNGSPDSTFSSDGIQVIYASTGEDRIQSIAIANNKLYAVGFGQYPGYLGVAAKYKILSVPKVSITSPANNAIFTAPATIKITASASDADGTISSVMFYKGTTYLKTVYTSPYTCTLSSLPPGTYAFTAKATDNMGLQTTSAAVKVFVNKAPVASITSPLNNAIYASPATIQITATASDSDGTIFSVTFYNGTTLLKTVYTSPYTYTLSGVPPGTYSFTAKANDNHGAQTISAAVKVLVDKAPAVSITSPANNAIFTALATINITASASDSDGTISNVKFYNGTTLLNTDSTSPYAYTWSSVAAGTYSLTAKATDNHGIVTTSAVVKVSVAASKGLSPGNNILPVNSPPDSTSLVSLKGSPNPAGSILNIYTKGLPPEKQLTISVMSVSGVEMKVRRLNTSNTIVQIDVKSLVSGVYIIKVICGDRAMYKQFVKL